MAKKFITVSIEILRDKNLSPNQKFILAEIEQLVVLGKIHIASNTYFSKLIGITKQGVSRAIGDLEKKGYINTNNKSDEDVYIDLNKKNSKNGCLFCGYTGISIDKHHYPIRKRDGGEKTIDLCANCHREFHLATDSRGNGIDVVWSKINTSKAKYIKMIESI